MPIKSHNPAVARVVLRLIAERDGELSWYLLDREVAKIQSREDQLFAIPNLVKELESQGLISVASIDNRQVYRITDKGRTTLN